MYLNKKDRNLGIQPSNIVSKRSYQDCLTKPTASTRQLICIKDKIPISVNVMRLISAISSVSKFHIHMVIVLANLSARCDDSDSDKPLSLNKIMLSPYWKNFEKAMHAEF